MENWLEIDLKRLKNNYLYVKSKTKSEICAVIKADGYGVGSFEIAKELEDMGVKNFAVAFLNEAQELRTIGIKKEILIFNYISPEKLNDIVDTNFILTLYSLEQLEIYLNVGLEVLKRIRFHIKINSGMNRLGISREELDEFLDLIKRNNLNIEGTYSHFAHVEDDEFTSFQFNEFMSISKKIEKSLEKNLIKHISNSGATLKYSDYGLDFVRVGMSLYGLQALEIKNENIKGILTWKSKVSSLRYVKKGERISYGNEILKDDKFIGVIPVGYSHGYMRQLSGKGYILIKGQKCPIIGKVFMDQMSIDFSKMENIQIGDEIILLGDGVEAEVLAKLAGTIADDIVSKISPRIERVIIK